MFGALAKITFREWQQHKLRLALTVLGISLGVAVYFAIQTANRSLVSSLHSTIDKLAGKSTLQITAGEPGFDMGILSQVRAVPGVLYAEPVTETYADTALGEKLLILGLDTTSNLDIYDDSFDHGNITVSNPLAFSNRTDSIAVSRSFAARFGLKEGDKIAVETQSGKQDLTIRGLFSESGAGSVFSGSVAVMDLVSAQDSFGRGNRIDRIDVANAENVTAEQLEEKLTAILPSGIRVIRPELRGQSLENSVSSLNYGLTIMSVLALTIGVFIIYNSFGISLNQRWKQIGILRALGVSRANIQFMFLVEAALLGLIGAIVGVGAGYGLARISLRVVGDVTAQFYGFAPGRESLGFDWVFAIQAALAGMATSLIAAWIPARRAARLNPALALHNIETRQAESAIAWPRLAVGIVLVAAGLILTSTGIGAWWNIQQYYTFIIQLGMILLVPKFIQLGALLLRRPMGIFFGAEGNIAVENMAAAARRTSSTVIALMIGLAFVFSYGSFIRSQKTAINRSMDKALGGDILITSSNEIHSRVYHMPQETASKITSMPGVETADTVRVSPLDYDGLEIMVIAHDTDKYFQVSPDLLDRGNTEAARAAMASGEGMLVSTNFATRWNLSVGDKVTIDTPSGPLTLPIFGSLDYFRSSNGTVFIDRSVYTRYWHDTDIDYIIVDLLPGVDRIQFKSNVNALLAGRRQAFVYTHDEYKAWASQLVDQFFALMYVQMVVAFIVATIGLINTMFISVAERKREIGVFRAIGGYRRQVIKMVLLEALAISIIGFILGTVAGLMNAYYLVNTATRLVAGFTLPLVFPASMILAAVPLVLLSAIIASWLPARNAAKLNVIEAISYE